MTEREIFVEALQKETDRERSAFLDGACGKDTELRKRVEQLLAKHAKKGDFFLDGAAAGLAATINTAIAEGPGSVVGNYKLLQEIGEGGMGVVYMAEQREPVRRRVALKIIKPGMDTREVVARFEAERQALALMDHPNIARVLDAGATASGRPYFVMELVRGVPITEYCDANRLPTHGRLKLFVAVCQAVQHSHQKGIIHRDLKPSNILVTLADGQPIVKVIDFGVAKAINQQLTEKTYFTAHGQMVGTPQYMAPEQAEMSALDVDTKSDVYSLGVVLYELLTGTTPFEADRLRAAGYVEMQRIIRDEEPPWPSVRLSKVGERLTIIADSRAVEPKKLSQLVRGELDWIAMKTLEKVRGRRYETPAHLAADVQRFLGGEAVEAHPPSRAYRLRKFVCRNRLVAAGVSAVLVTLLLGIMGTSLGWDAARRNRDAAADAEKVARTEAARAVEAWERESKARRTLDRQNLTLSMSEAFAAWHVGNLTHAEELMHSCRRRAEQEGATLEIQLLQTLLDNSRPTATFPSDGEVKSLAFSTNGRYLVLGLLNGGVTVWNLETQQAEVLLAPGIEEITYSVVFSPDDIFLVAGRGCGTSRGEVLLWQLPADGDSKFIKKTFAITHKAPVSDVVAFRTNAGLMGTSVSLDGVIQRWAIPAGAITATESVLLPPDCAEKGCVENAQLSANGDTLALVCKGRVFVSGWKGWQLRSQCEVGWISFNGLALCPKDNWLACGAGCTVRLFQCETSGLRTAPTPLFLNRCFSLSFSPDGSLLAGGGDGGRPFVTLWDTRTWRQVGKVVHGDSIRCNAVSPDGSWLASAGTDHTVKLWGLGRLRKDAMLTVDSPQRSLAVSPDGKTIAFRGENNTMMIWDTDSGAKYELCGHAAPVQGAAFSPDGSTLATASDDRSVKLWNVKTKQCTKTLEGHADAVHAVAFLTRDGSKLASGGAGGELWWWDIQSNKKRLCPGHGPGGAVWCMKASPDYKVLVSGTCWTPSGEEEAILWDLSGSLPEKRKGPFPSEAFNSIAFSPDSQYFALGCVSSKVKIRRVTDLTEVSTLDGEGAWMTGVSFSPDGKYVITAGMSGEIRIFRNWNQEGVQQDVTKVPGTEQLRRIEFFPDGNAFVTAAMDGSIRVWRIIEVQGNRLDPAAKGIRSGERIGERDDRPAFIQKPPSDLRQPGG